MFLAAKSKNIQEHKDDHDVPYIWNEIKFSVAYETDLEFVADTMQRIAAEEVGKRMMKQVRVFRELLAQTPSINSRFASIQR